MKGELISSGIPEVDELLGGGIIENGLLLIDYSYLSMGWTLGIKIFKSIIQRGGFGIIINTTIPVSKLKLRTEYMWLDIDKEGEKGNLIIIDLFGSKHNIPSDDPYVYQIREWDDELALQKMGKLMKELMYHIVPKDRLIVSMVATVEGAYCSLGERITKGMMLSSLKTSEISHKAGVKTIEIFLLNRDAVKKEFETFLTIISDQVIMVDRESTKDGFVEYVTVPKSPVPGFAPKVKYHKIKRG